MAECLWVFACGAAAAAGMRMRAARVAGVGETGGFVAWQWAIGLAGCGVRDAVVGGGLEVGWIQLWAEIEVCY
jgi:hypothetical protein